MLINLQSLNTIQDNARVNLNTDGTFQKASFFSKKAVIDQNKQNIVDVLKQTIASDPKYFGVQKHLEGMIDGLMTSKLSAKGITAGQIKDILAYADSLSTPKDRRNCFMSQAMSKAFTLHKTNENDVPAELPKELATCSQAMKNAYSTSLHNHLKQIFNSTENLRDVNLENVIRQFDAEAVLIKDTANTLDMPAALADKFFAKGLEKNYSKQQLETLGDYYKQINDNPQLNEKHKNLLFDIVAADNAPLEEDKFEAAVLAKENDFIYQEVKNSEEYNSQMHDDLAAMGFAENDISAIKDQISKSIYDEVHKFVFNGTKATPDGITAMANDRIAQYQAAQQEIKSYAGDNANLEKIGMRTLADLNEIPKAGYLTALHTASGAINPAFIKEICHSGNLDRFDTALNKLAKAIFNSTNSMDNDVLPKELGDLKLNLTAHLLGECINTLSAEERRNLSERLLSPEITNLFSMYDNDIQNIDSMYMSNTLNFMRSQIALLDNSENIPFPQQACDYTALSRSLQNKRSLDSVFSGDLPKNILNTLNTAQYQERFDSITQSMLQVNFLAEMKKMTGLGSGEIIFKKDINRDLNITLPNGQVLTNNFETARNELASYVSHGQVTQFADLDPAQTRTVQVLMACLSQETEKIVNMGATMAINGERNEPAFICLENREANAGRTAGGRTFNVLEDGAGGFEIQYNCTRTINFFQESRSGGSVMRLAPASEEHYELNIHIPGDEIRRLQTADFGRLAELPAEVSIDDLVNWQTHFNLGECNLQNVSITGGFNLYGVEAQE